MTNAIINTKPQDAAILRRLKMSNPIKVIVLTVLFMSIQIQTVMGSELKLLSSTEFQQKMDCPKFVQEDLSKYEINNGELITLYKIKSEKRRLASVKRSKRILFVSLL
jgi:hypothetical protein